MERPPRTAVFHSQVVLDCSVDARMSAFISGVKLGTQREGVICFAEINAPKPGSSSFLPRSIISLRKIEMHLLGPGLSRLCRTRSFLLIIPNCSEAKDRLGRVKWVSQEPDQIFGSRAWRRKCAQGSPVFSESLKHTLPNGLPESRRCSDSGLCVWPGPHLMVHKYLQNIRVMGGPDGSVARCACCQA